MRIEQAKVIVTCPGRNFVTLKITTDRGIHGIGDATLNGRELAVASYLSEHVIPCLVGRDPRQSEDIWHYLYRGAYWRRGPVAMAVIAAVDVALWDIKAKLAGMPLYQLLGGRSRNHVLVYAHGHGRDIAEAVENAKALRARGYRAIRGQCGIPGLDKVYGVPKGGGAYEPADAALPSEHVWSTPKYLTFVPKLFEALRQELGDEVELLHDVHHRLTPNEAAQLGRALEPYRLFWMEDPTPAESQEGFRRIRAMTTTPIAVGEVFNAIWDCKDLITEQLIDYIRASLVHAGGITHMRRIAHLAELYHVRTGFHGATDLSPVTMGAALHFDLWVPNFGIQEHMPHPAEADEVFPHAYRFEDGFMYPGDAAGHGVDIDEQAAARFPYRPAYLPVNRLEDGTLWQW
jgi:mannonate dehydratase